MGKEEGSLVNGDLLQHATTVELQTYLDQQSCMIEAIESHRGTVESVTDSGRKLISRQVAGAARIEQKLCSLKQRYASLCLEVRDRKHLILEWIAFRDILQEIDMIQEWLCEKKERLDEVDQTMAANHLTPEDKEPYRSFVGKQYAQLRQLESELDTHTQRIQQIFQNVVNTIVQHPKLSDRLKVKLGEITSQWDDIRRQMRDRIACMVQMHRAIIFQDGCLRLELWLKAFADKLGLTKIRDLIYTPKMDDLTPTVESEGSGLLTPCGSLHNVNDQLKTVNSYLEESKSKQKLLEELREHASILLQASPPPTTTKSDQVPDLNNLENCYWIVRRTVEKRWAQIDAQKHCHQLLYDLGDEQIWIRERISLAGNQDVGRSLLAVNQLIRRHRLLLKEVAVRDERVELLLKEADTILTQWRTPPVESLSGSKKSDLVLLHSNGTWFRLHSQVLINLANMCADVRQDRVELSSRLKQRGHLLDVGHSCLKHLTDFGELCAWLEETEAIVLLDSRASRDTVTAKAELRKHANLELRINGLLAANVRDFNAHTLQLLHQSREQADELMKQLHSLQRPDADLRSDTSEQRFRDRKQLKRHSRARYKQLMKRIEVLKDIQATIDRQYASLRDICVEKRQRLEELLALNVVYEEVADFENWMHQQTQVAAASTTGRDMPECFRLLNQFNQFAADVLGIQVQSLTGHNDTQTSIEAESSALIPEVDEEQTVGLTGGALRMARVVNMCRCLIRTRHSDAPQIAFWQDRLTETWADLNELVHTRWVQLVHETRRQMFLTRCEELQEFIEEKAKQLPDDVGANFVIINQQLTQQNLFEQDFQAMELQLQELDKAAEKLLPLYAGKWAARLTKPRDNLSALMIELRERMQRRRKRLEESVTLHRWLTTVNEIVRWIQTCQADVNQVINQEVDKQITLVEMVSVWSTESLRARLALMFHYRTEMDARHESVMSCLRKGEELYRIFLSQSEQEVQDKVEDTINGLCTPNIVVDTHQVGVDSTEEATLPYSFLNRPSFGEESQTATTELDEKRISESIGIKSSSHVDSPSGYEMPSTSSTKYSGLKSYQSAAGSDEDLGEEETNYQSGKLVESPDPEFSTDDKELIMLSPTLPAMPSASRSPSIQTFSSSKEVKQHMYDLITKWCELHQFWCEVYRRLKFQLCAASFASEADAAEQWLEVHEADLQVNENEDSIQSIANLIQRHEALEHNLRLQADRFERLKRPTQMEVLNATQVGYPPSEKSCSRGPEWSDRPGVFLVIPTLDAMLRQFGLESETNSVSGDQVEQQEDIQTRSSNEAENTEELIFKENMGDMLWRKHECVAHLVRARDRTWYEMYVLIETNKQQLLFYRSKSDYDMQNPLAHTFRNELGLNLGENNLSVSIATDYTKRPHVFRILNPTTGLSYLFQAPNGEVMQRWVDRLNSWLLPPSPKLSRPKSATVITLSRPQDEYDGPPELLGRTEPIELVTDISIDVPQPELHVSEAHSSGAWGLRSVAPKQVLRWFKRKQSLNALNSSLNHGKDTKSGIIRSSTTQTIVSGRRPMSASSSRSHDLKRSSSVRKRFGFISGSQTLPPRFRSPSRSGMSAHRAPSFLCPGRRKSSKRIKAGKDNVEIEEFDLEPHVLPGAKENGSENLLSPESDNTDGDEQ